MLNELTPEQKVDLKEFQEKWFKVFSYHKKPDKIVAETAIRNLYTEANRPQPKYIIWYESPFTAILAKEILRMKRLLKPTMEYLYQNLEQSLARYTEISIGQFVRYPSQMSLGNYLASSFKMIIYHSLKGCLDRSLYKSLGAQLIASLEMSFDQLKQRDRSIVRSLLTSMDRSFVEAPTYFSLKPDFFGLHDSSWIAFYLFCKYLGVNYDKQYIKRLNLFADIAQSCCLWWPFENAVIISEKPEYIKLDNNKRIHAIAKPAIKFRDGWSVYAVHGTLIPEWWGEKKESEWKPEWLLQIDNVEQKRVLLEVCGYERIMQKLNTLLIHTSEDMELRRIDDIDNEPVVLLKVKCPSTNAFYCLRVPPYMKKCEDARQWTFGNEPLNLIEET